MPISELKWPQLWGEEMWWAGEADTVTSLLAAEWKGESLEESQSWRFLQDDCIGNGKLSLYQENGNVRNISETQIMGDGWLNSRSGTVGRGAVRARGRKGCKSDILKTVLPRQSPKGEELGLKCVCNIHKRKLGCHLKWICSSRSWWKIWSLCDCSSLWYRWWFQEKAF